VLVADANNLVPRKIVTTGQSQGQFLALLSASMSRKLAIAVTRRRMASRLENCSRFLRAPFQFNKRAAGEAAEFGRSGIELLDVVGAARLECGEPAAEARELIRRQVGDGFGDFFDFHAAHYSTGRVERGKEIGRFRLLRVGLSSLRLGHLSRGIRNYGKCHRMHRGGGRDRRLRWSPPICADRRGSPRLCA
jgi:hypothetical protein